jgi:hypothetical protein
MDISEVNSAAAIELLGVLDDLDYKLAVKTRVEVHEHRGLGFHSITYADKLLVFGGPGPLDEMLREAVREHQPYLLAAACVREPPIEWLRHVVDGYRGGQLPAQAVSANVASFMGKSPVRDGAEFEPIIVEALNGSTL